MGKNKMCAWVAVIGLLAAVCMLTVGCKGPAAKPSAKLAGPYDFTANWLGEDGFITNWLVVGPFPNPGERPNNEGFHTDYLENYGGEAKYVPDNEKEVKKPDGTTVTWQRYDSVDTEIDFFAIDHLNLYYQQDDILAYAACWLECEDDKEVEIRVGSDDGYKLWVDHELIGEQHVYRCAAIDQEIYPMELSKGWHLVLIKVDQDYGDFKFMLRVVTPDGKKVAGMKVYY